DELDADRRLLGEVLRQPLERRDEAEVVERLGPQLDREPPDVLQRRADEVAHLADRGAQRGLVLRLLEPAQAEEDRRQRLARLVVQLTRETPPLELLRRDDALERVPRDALPQLDGDRGARTEDLREAQVAVAEARVRAELVVHRDHAE